MAESASTLPAGWSSILDEMHARLEQAIASADAREKAHAPTDADTTTKASRDDLAHWHERAGQLHAFVRAAESKVQQIDEILLAEETILRQSLAVSESLRQKLAQAANAR